METKGGPVIQKSYDLLKYMIGVLKKFPRDQRFLLGDRIQGLLMDIQSNLIITFYSEKNQKRSLLKDVNLKIEQLRWFIRLSYELGYIDSRRHNFIALQINEIGKMVGGWSKYLK